MDKNIYINPIFILIIVITTFTTLGIIGAKVYENSLQEYELYPKTDITVITTVNWNNTIVTYNSNKIKPKDAENIFAAQYEKYGQNLKELNIAVENKTCQLSLLFQDGTTKEKTLH